MHIIHETLKELISINKTKTSYLINNLFLVYILLGFLLKYNYILLIFFYVPSYTGLIVRNITIILFYILLLGPLIKKKQTGKLYWIYIAFSGIYIIGYLYYSYFGNYFSIIDYLMSENTGRFGNMRIFIENVNPLILLGLFFDFPFITFLYYKFKKNKKFLQNSWNFSFSKKTLSFSLIIVLLLLAGQIYYTNNLFGSHGPQELYHRSTSKFVNVYGYFPLYLIEIYEQFNPYQADYETPTPDFLKGELQGRDIIDDDTNIIVIQVESLDEKMIDHEYNNQEITPYLNELKNNSLYFPNFIIQHIRASFNADFSFLTSLYPVNKNYTYRANDMSQFQSITNLLNQAGYQTLAFHGYHGDFFNRDIAFNELGFDRFYTEDDYSFNDAVMETDKDLGINDYDFFKQSLDFLEKSSDPFFGFFITVTSHNPFDYYPPSEEVEAFKDIDDPLVKDLYNSLAFVDSSIEMFINELDARGLKDDSLIIIYSDHESLIDREAYSSGRDYELKRNIKKPEHVPLFIKHPEIEPEIDERAVSILDLSPTILDLLGKTEIPEEFLGRSILDGKEYPILYFHEVPQVLYKDHLYLINSKRFELVGNLKETTQSEPEISDSDKSKLRETIDYLRKLYLTRRR